MLWMYIDYTRTELWFKLVGDIKLFAVPLTSSLTDLDHTSVRVSYMFVINSIITMNNNLLFSNIL